MFFFFVCLLCYFRLWEFFVKGLGIGGSNGCFVSVWVLGFVLVFVCVSVFVLGGGMFVSWVCRRGYVF